MALIDWLSTIMREVYWTVDTHEVLWLSVGFTNKNTAISFFSAFLSFYLRSRNLVDKNVPNTWNFQYTFSNNDRVSSDESGNPIVCFVCDPICQIRRYLFLIWHIELVMRGIGNLGLRSEKCDLNMFTSITMITKIVYGWPYPWGGGLQKNCTRRLKVDFRISTISIPQKAWFCDPSLYQIAAKNTQFETNWVLFGLIFRNTPNFAIWAHWVLNGNPSINIPIMTKKHPQTFEHPRKPSSSENPHPSGIHLARDHFLKLFFFFFSP